MDEYSSQSSGQPHGPQRPQHGYQELGQQFAAPFTSPHAPYAQPAPAAPLNYAGMLDNFRGIIFGLTPRVYVTYVILAINILVFLLMLLNGVHPFEPKTEQLLTWGADFGPLTVHGQWWRLLTSVFIHIGLIHIAMNMIILCVAGPFVERLLGPTGFLIAYIFAGLTGSLASTLWNPFQTSAGASGAIFGLYGAMMGFVTLRRDFIPKPVITGLLKSGGTFVLYNVIYGMQPASHIDNAAHLGGLAGGFVCGLLLSQQLTLEAGHARRRLRNFIAACVCALVIAAGITLASNDLHNRSKFQLATLEYAREQAGEVLKVESDAYEQFKSGKLPAADYAKLLQTKVLPRWDANVKLISSINVAAMPPKTARYATAMRDYLSVYEQHMKLTITALQQDTPQAWTAVEQTQRQLEQLEAKLVNTPDE